MEKQETSVTEKIKLFMPFPEASENHGLRFRVMKFSHSFNMNVLIDRGTQREYSSKPLKHSIVKRTLVFKR